MINAALQQQQQSSLKQEVDYKSRIVYFYKRNSSHRKP